MNTPLVSIIIFTYNQREYIRESIESVLKQKINFSYEIIINDDASNDGTYEIIKEYQRKHRDIITIIRNPINKGVQKSFVNAILTARGYYIASLAGDDYWIDEYKIIKQIEIFKRNNDVILVHTNYNVLVEKENKIIKSVLRKWKSPLTRNGKDPLINVFLLNWSSYPLGSSSMYLRNSIVYAIIKNKEVLKYNYSGEGPILHSSLAYYKGKYFFLNETTTTYRIREKSLSNYTDKKKYFDFERRHMFFILHLANEYKLDRKLRKKILKHHIIRLMKISIHYEIEDKFWQFCKAFKLKKYFYEHLNVSYLLIKKKYKIKQFIKRKLAFLFDIRK